MTEAILFRGLLQEYTISRSIEDIQDALKILSGTIQRYARNEMDNASCVIVMKRSGELFKQ